MAETLRDAYGRGVEDGKIAIRLDHHDEQIAGINRLLTQSFEIQKSLTSTVQTLTEARVTDAATRVATAQAVKDAKNAQEDQATKAWSPATKLMAVLASVGVVIVTLWAVLDRISAAIAAGP